MSPTNLSAPSIPWIGVHPFTPDSIADLKWWINAPTESFADGDSVTTMTDRKSGFNLTPAGTQAVYHTGIQNGLSAYQTLTTGSEYKTVDASSLWPVSEMSLFAAFAPTSPIHYTILANNTADVWWWHDTGGGTSFMGPFQTARVAGFPNPALPTSGWHYISIVSGADYRIWVNGVEAGGSPQTKSWDAGTLLWMMPNNSDPQGQNRMMDGYLGEILIYNRALITTERQQVEAYMTRWV